MLYAAHNGLLVLEAALLPQHVGQKGHEQPMLLRELKAHDADRVDNHLKRKR